MHPDRVMPGPEDVFLDLPDRRLRARWVAPPPPAVHHPYAPTLVFVHEGLGCIELWRSFPEALCRRTGLRAFLYDRTGCGWSSPWPSPPGIRYLGIESARVLPQVLDAAGVEACLLIGHGDGGALALRFAADQPPLLRGVVVIGTQTVREDRTVASLTHAREAYRTTDLRARLAVYHGDNVDAMFHTWNDAWLDPAFEPLGREPHLPRVRVPVLALQGEHDEYGSVAQLHVVARGVSGRCETRRMPGCGYAPHLQDEATLVEVVARFVETLWRGPGGRAAAVLVCALGCLAGAPRPAVAQPDPCAAAAVQAVLTEARQALDRADDSAAAGRLQPSGTETAQACHEIGLAALAVAGWVEARRQASLGGAPAELGHMRDVLARLETVRAARPPTATLSQLAAYADAVLRAAVAAAQDERDEMHVYLAHARALAERLSLAGGPRLWPLPIAMVEGELWLEVDRYTEARDAFARVTDDGLMDRAALGAGQALERLKDVAGACAAYRKAAAGRLAPPAVARARAGLLRLACPA